jgi:hypothetical protein
VRLASIIRNDQNVHVTICQFGGLDVVNIGA